MAYNQAGEERMGKLVLRGGEGQTRVPAVDINYASLGKSYASWKSVIPTFNHDRLYFTPAFLLPADQKYYLQNETFELFQFKDKIQRNLELLAEHRTNKHLNILKPAAPNTTYCQICQQKYDNYFEHTSLESHLQIAHNNPINTAIEQLCFSFNHTLDQDSLPTKTKGIKKGRLQKQQKSAHQTAKEQIGEEGNSCFGKSGSTTTVLLQNEGLASSSD